MEEVPGEEAVLPTVGADVKVNNYASALRVALALCVMQRELHSTWDDSVPEERVKHGSLAQKYGREWGLAARGHVNNKVKYFYIHLSMYHLKDIIVINGHPLLGDDAIQEISNKETLKLKPLLFHCPTSRDKVKVVRYKKVKHSQESGSDADGEESESEYEEHVVYRKPMPPVAAQVKRLQKLKQYTREKRGFTEKKSKSKSQKVRKAAEIKTESKRRRRDEVCEGLELEQKRLAHGGSP